MSEQDIVEHHAMCLCPACRPENYVRAANEVTELQREIETLRASLAQARSDGHKFSNAYVRLRALIPGAFNTPHAPSPEQIWQITEDCLSAMQTALAQAQRRIEALEREREWRPKDGDTNA